MNIVIIDYGMGNTHSIISALNYLGFHNVILTNDSQEISFADKLILPGVGSFAKAMKNIYNFHLDEILHKEVIENKKPILGICLGMQLMAKSSLEDGFTKGLEFIDTDVINFSKTGNLKIPHIGFNQVKFNNKQKLYRGLVNPSDFYFTHSYKINSTHHLNQAICTYGEKFIASFEVNNIAGVQFHPELSQKNGLTLLNNFIKNF
jgi:glutamine amidotransferase